MRDVVRRGQRSVLALALFAVAPVRPCVADTARPWLAYRLEGEPLAVIDPAARAVIDRIPLLPGARVPMGAAERPPAGAIALLDPTRHGVAGLVQVGEPSPDDNGRALCARARSRLFIAGGSCS